MSDNYGQTQFSNQEPVLEKNTVVTNEVSDQSAGKEKKSQTRKVLLILVAVLAVIIVVLLGLLLFLPSNSGNNLMPEVSPSPSVAPMVNESEQQAAVKALKTDLTAADPSVENFAFPPVDLEFVLED